MRNCGENIMNINDKNYNNIRKMGMNNRKSQVTIFIIIAVIIISAVALIFILKASDLKTLSPVDNPKGYMEDCMAKALDENLPLITKSGGLLNPKNSFYFNKTNVTMMCSTLFYEKLCTNAHPMLSVEIEKQIATSIKSRVDGCFAKVKDGFKNSNYKESSKENLILVSIMPKIIILKSDKKISYTKDDQTISIEGFTIKKESSLFDFIRLQTQIVNDELNCQCGLESCNADVVKLSMDNPNYEIQHFVASVGNPKFGDGEEVYTIKSILLNEEFNFALRNCVRRPFGYSGPL